MKKLLGTLIFCLLLAVGAATAMAAGYSTASYVRHGADGGIDAVLRLYETQDGTFVQVTVYDAQDDGQPLLAAVGRLNNGTLLLDDYEQKRGSRITKYTTFGGQAYINGQAAELPYPQVLLCELRLDADRAVLLPTINDRELGSSSVGSPDICGSYMFASTQLEGLSGQLALHYLRELGKKATGIELLPMYTYQFGRLEDESEGSTMRRFMGIDEDPYADEGAYTAVYVYKYDTLLMSYYVHPMLRAAYRVTPTGEVLVVMGDEAEE